MVSETTAPDEAPLRLREEGNRYFQIGDFENAIEKYKEGLQCFDNHNHGSSNLLDGEAEAKAALYNNISQCYLKQGKCNEAIEAANAAIVINPRSEKAVYRRAIAYESIGRLKEALSDASILSRQGNKEGAVMLKRIKQKLMVEQDTLLDATLPDKMLINITRIQNEMFEKRINSHKKEKCDPPPLLSTSEANDIISAMDMLKIWVLKHNKRKLMVDNGSIDKSIKILKSSFFSFNVDQPKGDENESSLNQTEQNVSATKISNTTSTNNNTREDLMENMNLSCTTVNKYNRTEADSSVDNKTGFLQCNSLLMNQRLTAATDAKNAEDEAFVSKSPVTDRDTLRVHLAVLRFIAILITDFKTYDEDKEDAEARVQQQIQLIHKPIKDDPEILRAREIFLSCISFDEMYELFRAYLRHGLGVLTDDQAIQSDSCLRSRCAISIVGWLSSTGSLDGGSALEIISLGINATECPALVNVSLQTLGNLADYRRRFGSQVKALMKSQALMKALENSLQLLSVDTDSKTKAHSEFAITSVFQLLADKDRSASDEVDIKELITVLLGPYFATPVEPSAVYIGLRAVIFLWLVDRSSVKAVISANQYISTLLHLTCNRVSEIPELQNAAADVLAYAMEFRELRDDLMEISGISELSDLCKSQLREQYKKDSTLRLKVLLILARLSTHSEETRREVFKDCDFYQMASFTLNNLNVPKNQTKNTNISDTTIIIRGFVEVLFFLTLHGDFKRKLLESMKSNEAALKQSARFADIGEALVEAKDNLGGYHFSNTICNLLRSRDDKERRRRNAKVGSSVLGGLDDEQLDALEDFYKKLPQCFPQEIDGKFDRGDAAIVPELVDLLVDEKIVKHLSQLCLLKSATPNELSAAAEAVGLIAKHPKHRGRVVQQGGLTALLAVIKALTSASSGGVLYEEDISCCRQSIAHICISVRSSFLTYREVLDIVPHLLALLTHGYELYQYEAALALTNISCESEEARVRMYHGGGWQTFIDVATGSNDLCRAAGLEGLCNMAMCELVLQQFAEGRRSIDLQILLAFLREKENVRAQSAASGCLAFLTSDIRVARRLCLISNCANIVKSINDAEEMKEKPQVLLRIATAAVNIHEALKIKEPIFVSQHSQAESGETIAVTDQMQSIMKKIYEAFNDADRSNYSEEVLKLVTRILSDPPL